MPAGKLSRSARRVQSALAELGLARDVTELAGSTRTAAEAAAAVGCTVGQIAKSLVFRTAGGGEAVLVVASGANRVDVGRLEQILGEPVLRPDADFVRARTGFAIGGVPPVGHARALRTLIDADLRGFDRLWAAAGNPRAVFALTPDELERITGGEVVELAERLADP